MSTIIIKINSSTCVVLIISCLLSPVSCPVSPVWIGKDSVVVTEEAREQLLEASTITKKAYGSYRRDVEPEETLGPAEGQQSSGDKAQDNGRMDNVFRKE